MSVICIGGICIPYSVFWPIIVLLLKPAWDFIRKLFGYEVIEVTKKTTITRTKEKLWKSGVAYELTNNEELDILITQNKVSILRFTAAWCKPCKSIEPIFHELASSHSDLTFITVDVDKCDETAAKFLATSIPLFVACVDGKEAGRFSGRDEEKLRTFVKEYRSKQL